MLIADSCLVGMVAVLIALTERGCGAIPTTHGSALIPTFSLKRRFPTYFLAGRGIGVTPTCSSAVYGAP